MLHSALRVTNCCTIRSMPVQAAKSLRFEGPLTCTRDIKTDTMRGRPFRAAPSKSVCKTTLRTARTSAAHIRIPALQCFRVLATL
eukprot:6204965-Pleurochrysis_carterae.AAC.3